MNIQTPSKQKWIVSLLIFFGSVIVLGVLSHSILLALYGESYIEESFKVAMTFNVTVLVISIALTYWFLSIRVFDISRASKLIGLTFIGFLSYLFCDFILSFISERAFFWQSWEYQISDLFWMGVIFLGAWAEELIFRRYLIDLSKALGANLLVSILLSSIVFALFHLGGFESPIPLIISGIVYCVVTIMTKSIAFAVGAHFAFNLFAELEGVESLDHSLTSGSVMADSIMLDVGLLGVFLFGYYLYSLFISGQNSKPLDYSA